MSDSSREQLLMWIIDFFVKRGIAAAVDTSSSSTDCCTTSDYAKRYPALSSSVSKSTQRARLHEISWWTSAHRFV